MTDAEPNWLIALRSPKLIKLIRFPFSAATDDAESVQMWQAAIPSEGTPLELGLAKIEDKERDFG